MLHTRVCDVFGVQYPIIQGGMIWVSGWKLAAAVSGAGGLGLIGAGSMNPELLREHIRKAKAACEKPFGVNLPIFFNYAEEMARVIIDEGVKIVFTSGGSPKKFTKAFRDAGMRVAHVTSTPALAKKCEEAGVDAVVVEGFEAGGHNGRDELTTMALVSQTAELVKTIPVIAAGGIYNGATMAAVLCMGAEGAQVGTRFAASAESSAHEGFKRAMLEASASDTALLLRKLIPVRVIKNDWAARVAAAESAGAGEKELLELLGEKRSRLGMFEGDVKEGELEIGQVVGALKDLPGAAEIVEKMAKECVETLRRAAKLAE